MQKYYITIMQLYSGMKSSKIQTAIYLFFCLGYFIYYIQQWQCHKYVIKCFN